MFVRTKKSTNHEHTAVQIVENTRVSGKTKQRVVRHVGTATTPEALQELKKLAETIKVTFEHAKLRKEKNLPPSSASPLANRVELSTSTPIDLFDIGSCEQVILGIHDVYGWVYEAVGFGNVFTRAKQREKAAKILREIVLARIARPASKRASVDLLSEAFGVDIKLDNVYQMMDKIDMPFCERIQQKALSIALALKDEKLKVLFYDATTLYFESFSEDDLKQNGYSKDMKFNQPQVLLALFVTEKGLPIGYEVFPGATFEGHTLIPVLEKLKTRYAIDDVIFVADRGMLSKENITYLNENNFYYIVGARLKSLKKNQQHAVLDWAEILDKTSVDNEVTHRMSLQEKQHLILSYRVARAHKDKADREKSIQKVTARLAKTKNPKQLISNYGFQKFISVTGEAQLHIDQDKLKEEAKWDGLIGIFTNHPTLSNEAVLSQYRGLWQVEESFRISKHDLRIRPIYHWTPKRVRAHIAIAFMAFVCVRYLEYRIQVQSKKLSPEKIRQSLLNVRGAIIADKQAKKTYLLPPKVNAHAKDIYRVLGLKWPRRSMRLKSNPL